MKNILIACFAFIVLLASSTLILSEQPEATTNFMGSAPSSEQLVDALKMPADTVLKFRGIYVKPLQPKVVLDIRFKLDSDKLTDDAKEALSSLGKALKDSELEQNIFVIEGHTDSRGTEQYNKSLSKLRALAVKDYLVKNYGVNPSRLEPIGKGEEELLNAALPESGENRRVEVINRGLGNCFSNTQEKE